MIEFFSLYLSFFADHFFKGFIVGIGLLCALSAVVTLAGLSFKFLGLLLRGHPPAAQGRTTIKCEKVITDK